MGGLVGAMPGIQRSPAEGLGWTGVGARTCSTGGVSSSILGRVTHNCFPGDAQLHVGQLLGWARAEQGGDGVGSPPFPFAGTIRGVAAGGRLILCVRQGWRMKLDGIGRVGRGRGVAVMFIFACP